MKLIVDHAKCTGLGMCESTSPDYFEVDDDGNLVLLREQVEPDDLDAITRAVVSCPTGALSIVS